MSIFNAQIYTAFAESKKYQNISKTENKADRIHERNIRKISEKLKKSKQAVILLWINSIIFSPLTPVFLSLSIGLTLLTNIYYLYYVSQVVQHLIQCRTLENDMMQRELVQQAIKSHLSRVSNVGTHQKIFLADDVLSKIENLTRSIGIGKIVRSSFSQYNDEDLLMHLQDFIGIT